MSRTTEQKISLAEKEAGVRKRRTAMLVGALILVTAIAGTLSFMDLPWPTGSDAIPNTASEPDATGSKIATAQQDTFKQLLKNFQAVTEPALSEASVAKWAEDRHNEILAHKEEALQAFGASNYTDAVAALQRAAEVADDVLQLAAQRFIVQMNEASGAFERGDADVAQASITQALLLRPDNPEATAMKARIAVLPEVLRLSALADKARVENDFRSWQRHLAEIARLDPARQDVQAQLKEVTAKINRQNFADYIASGMAAVLKRDLHTAQQFLQQAKKIYPKREEVVLLQRNIQQLEREIAVQKHLAAAQLAVTRDDWATAYISFERARSVDDTDAKAVDGARLATQILNAHKEISGYQARPQRLSSENVAVAAQAALQRAEGLYRESPSLAQQGRTLAALIASYSTPLEIVVYSDNKTDILVHRVGKIGRTLEKTISLKPGTYTFEGKRPGYRSKLVQVEVRHGQLSEVTVICDEPV